MGLSLPHALKALFLLGLIFVLMGVPAYAEKVSAVHPEGNIQLDDGRIVSLAGVELVPESVNLLKVLLEGKKVSVRPAPDLILGVAGSSPVYLYTHTAEIRIPLPQSWKIHEQEVMVNELVLGLGAGRVIEDTGFSKRKDFLRIQEGARARGEGVWSYSDQF